MGLLDNPFYLYMKEQRAKAWRKAYLNKYQVYGKEQYHNYRYYKREMRKWRFRMKKVRGEKIMPGEKCKKCNVGEMTHPDLYIFSCNHCGYTYEMDPNAPRNQSGIKVLNRGAKQ